MALGVVLTPYGHTPGSPPYSINYSYKGASEWRQPFDAQFYRRGEAGYYYDTPLGAGKQSWWKRFKQRMGLGAIPTDFELATVRGYLPVESGWVTTRQGYQTGGWQPPRGRYAGYPYDAAPPMAPLNGLGGLGVITEGTPTVLDVMAEMQAHNDRVFTLTLVSTTAVTVSALIGFLRTLKLIKDDK